MSNDENIREKFHIWNSLRETGEYEGISISKEIRDSWARSERYGVDPYKPCSDVILSEAELSARRAGNGAFIDQADVMMGHLHRFTEGSGFVYTLGDSDGYILVRKGDREALDFADVSNLMEGANWSEQVMGTTSQALAQHLRKPVQLLGYENYCRISVFSCSSSSPIYDDDGNLIGTLNAVGPYRPFNNHTTGMIVAASRAIERQMALQNSYHRSEMANFHKTAIMDSLSDGVLTLDRAGQITHINHLAGKSLGINYRNAEGKRLEDLMLPKNELFLSKISASRRLYNEPLLIRRKNDVVRLAVSCAPLTNRDSKILETVVVLQPMQQYKHLIKRVSGTRAKITFDDIIGESNQLKFTLNLAKTAAKSDSNVLLLGESGVGKEMFAQAIHNASNRSKEPFFAINCAGLPRELISSELFGYEEGAFTGARKGGNPGKFELADQGTLFLDEIGEMPIDLQGTLLRFLEEGTLIRLGGREQIPVNVRIIAATNKKLPEEVKKGNFRLDLYYRLAVIDIKIPSLRERKNDIPELIHRFIQNMGPRLGKIITGIDSKAMSVLLSYDWPGNVRELNNVIERAIHFSSENTLTSEVLPPEMTTGNKEFLPEPGETLNKDLVEEQLIRKCLEKHRGNKSLAAKELGMSRATIYRKILKYSIM